MASEARKRLKTNILTNVLEISFRTLVGLWLTRFFIERLGLGLYSIIPLVISIIGFFLIINSSLISSIGRFVSIAYFADDFERSNRYFNSAVFALTILSGAVLLGIWAFSGYFPRLFNIPPGHEAEAVSFLNLAIVSSLAVSMSSPFLVSTLIRHRFDIANSIKIAGKLLQAGLVMGCFIYFGPSLVVVGWAYMIAALTGLVLAWGACRHLTPQLKLNLRLIDLPALREMAGLGSWTLLDSVGSYLYLSISLVLINVFLGAESAGYYAPVVQIMMLLVLVADTLSSVMTPVVYEYVARQDLSGLTRQLGRAMKYQGLILALPIGLCCGLADPLMSVWLGERFAASHWLVWILILPSILSLTVRPLFAVGRGLNRVRIPSLVTVGGGILNVAIGLLLILTTGLGLYAIALATTGALLLKNLIFTPLYTAHLLAARRRDIYRHGLPGVGVTLLLWLSGVYLNRWFSWSGSGELMVLVTALLFIYLVAVSVIIGQGTDREMLRSLLKTGARAN